MYVDPKVAGSRLDEVNFLNLLNPSSHIGLFLGSKVRPVRRADNLAAICEPAV
jgi:hypothetical protein